MCDPESELALRHEKASQQQIVTELQEKVDSLDRELISCKFSYSDPEPGFDRSKVKGIVAELIDLEEKNLGSSVALEVCAGAKLYNVVVDSETVGSQLLEKGKLKKRVTIIPLNKIKAFKVAAEVCSFFVFLYFRNSQLSTKWLPERPI
jgi:structural maintenance of chromosome 2